MGWETEGNGSTINYDNMSGKRYRKMGRGIL
jgi:hypothetical protein